MAHFFQSFSSNINGIELPKKFTFPFYYEPHEFCVLASKELQEYLLNQSDFEHDFGLNDQSGIGKMFGVLIVKNEIDEIGYLAAVSGKLGETNTHVKFVPPVYDILVEDSHYLSEKEFLKSIHAGILEIEGNENYLQLKKEYSIAKDKSIADIEEKKKEQRRLKQDRDRRRTEGRQDMIEQDFEELSKLLSKESLEAKQFFNNVNRYWTHTINDFEQKINSFESKVKLLRTESVARSRSLQQYINEQYTFLNASNEYKNLSEIFVDTALEKIPAGSGECAAPKLLQYAFLNSLKPIAMAEFWWGNSPNKEVRKHNHYYPACQGKCKPILSHMLDGIELDTNPFLENTAIGKELDIVFEDEYLLVVEKPNEFLSVPGVNVQDSVYSRMKNQIKDISGPIIVHRLDMSTSGLLLVAKNKRVHQALQKQFINRTVKKRYTAILDGVLTGANGKVTLPLRGDLEDRPRQLVCFEDGREAETHWEIISTNEGQTRVHFYPITGRTHQLRVHASHHDGLNAPILGDDLYGKKSKRLYLHADSIEFEHPITKERLRFFREARF